MDKLRRHNQAVEKKNKLGNFLDVVQLIHRLTQADISFKTTARCSFFHCLVIIGPHCVFLAESLLRQLLAARAAAPRPRRLRPPRLRLRRCLLRLRPRVHHRLRPHPHLGGRFEIFSNQVRYFGYSHQKFKFN